MDLLEDVADSFIASDRGALANTEIATKHPQKIFL